jgi:hypothetical protein
MNKLLQLTIAGSMALCGWSSGALAQDTPAAAPLRPTEVYTCNYVKGKGPADLAKVVSAWNAWMDQDATEAYSAWSMTPEYFGPGITFDVAWLGAWPDGATMGRGLDRWQRDGGKHARAFTSVIECNSHASFASMEIKAPGGNFPGDGIATFMDCKVGEGHARQTVLNAYQKWAAYLTSQGSTAGIWLYLPAYAGGKVEYDYKVVIGYANHQEMGAGFDRYTNKGGYEKAVGYFGGLVTCDSPRLYTAKLERNGMPAAR